MNNSKIIKQTTEKLSKLVDKSRYNKFFKEFYSRSTINNIVKAVIFYKVFKNLKAF